MVASDEDMLICDFAETYHCFDWRGLPLKTAAALASGLPIDSRIKKKMSGRYYSVSELLQAAMLDRMSLLVWMNSKDGQRGVNRPISVYEQMAKDPTATTEYMTFESIEAYEAARRALLEVS